jgi:hypothetical protein
MVSILVANILTHIYVLVDDWYQMYLPPPRGPGRPPAMNVLTCVRHSTILGDKGFIGEDWQADVLQLTGNQIWRPKRANQTPNPPVVDALFGRLR